MIVTRVMQAGTQTGADVAPQVKPSVTVVAGDGAKHVLHIPTTRQELRAVQARRQQLSDQLESVTDRRKEVIDQIKSLPGDATTGLKAQLRVLDARIVQLETDLATTGQELTDAPNELLAAAEPPSTPAVVRVSGRWKEGVWVGGGSVFLVMAALYLFSRRRWRQWARPMPVLPAADSERLERVERGVEAIAIEVERISEGQRFVTKLLADSHGVESAPVEIK